MLCLLLANERFYDLNGNYRGQLRLEGNRWVERDRQGNQRDYSCEGNQLVHRDNAGNQILGYATLN